MFWLGSLCAGVLEFIGLVLVIVIFCYYEYVELKDDWEDLPSDSECSEYSHENKCENQNCSWEDDVCSDQSFEDFYDDHGDWIRKRPMVWIGLFVFVSLSLVSLKRE
eukprot:UN34715